VVFGTAGNNHIIAAVVATEGLAFRTGRRAAKSLNIQTAWLYLYLESLKSP
jgi:hypothetical protein